MRVPFIDHLLGSPPPSAVEETLCHLREQHTLALAGDAYATKYLRGVCAMIDVVWWGPKIPPFSAIESAIRSLGI